MAGAGAAQPHGSVGRGGNQSVVMLDLMQGQVSHNSIYDLTRYDS